MEAATSSDTLQTAEAAPVLTSEPKAEAVAEPAPELTSVAKQEVKAESLPKISRPLSPYPYVIITSMSISFLCFFVPKLLVVDCISEKWRTCQLPKTVCGISGSRTKHPL